jgi:bifunctional pyridoxal-dependent enzyme with beta-cystathionase and maltose regulon repressor activities
MLCANLEKALLSLHHITQVRTSSLCSVTTVTFLTAFNSILSTRPEVVPIPAYFQPSNNFAWDISQLDEALAGAEVPVKALLLTSPNNPIGTIYPKEVLIEAVHWAKSKVRTSFFFNSWSTKFGFRSFI